MYAQLLNGTLSLAPHYITLDGMTVINPAGEQYLAAGYYPVVDTPPPEHEPTTHIAVRSYEQHDDCIITVWTVAELPPMPEPEPNETEMLSETIWDIMTTVIPATQELGE